MTCPEYFVGTFFSYAVPEVMVLWAALPLEVILRTKVLSQICMMVFKGKWLNFKDLHLRFTKVPRR